MNKEQILEHIIRETTTHYRAQIPFALPRAVLAEAAERFLDAIELPTIGDILPLRSHPEDKEATIGYTRRTADDRTGDVKKVIHFHPELFAELYSENISRAPQQVRQFIESAYEIHHAARELRNRVLDALELRFPGISSRFIQAGTHDLDYTRFLAYDVKQTREILARGHNDRGPLNFALAESAPGLRFGPPGYQTEIVHEDGKAIFQPGCAIEELCQDLFIPAWHDVLQGTHPPAREGVSRWAIVYFTDHHGKRPVEWEEAHTPVYHNGQTHPPPKEKHIYTA